MPAKRFGNSTLWPQINTPRALQIPFFDYNSSDIKCSDGDGPGFLPQSEPEYGASPDGKGPQAITPEQPAERAGGFPRH